MIVTILSWSTFKKQSNVSRDLIYKSDLVLIETGKGTYDVLKNRVDGKTYKDVSWPFCLTLMGRLQWYECEDGWYWEKYHPNCW